MHLRRQALLPHQHELRRNAPGTSPAHTGLVTMPSTDLFQQRKGAKPMSAKRELPSNVEKIRMRARVNIEQGAVTEGYRADRDAVIKVLNEALATELVCVLRYKRHYYMASGIHAKSVAAEVLEHANEEQTHADQIATRIVQLGGAPNFSPDGLQSRSHSEYAEGEDLVDMLEQDLIAERIAI